MAPPAARPCQMSEMGIFRQLSNPRRCRGEIVDMACYTSITRSGAFRISLSLWAGPRSLNLYRQLYNSFSMSVVRIFHQVAARKKLCMVQKLASLHFLRRLSCVLLDVLHH